VDDSAATSVWGRANHFRQNSLALTELYIVIACLFRRFDLELYDTIRERDIDIVRDCFIGEPSPQSKGVRVTVTQDHCWDCQE
jgi:hypothetical protein